MVGIRNPLTALLCRGKLSNDCEINSSNYVINSILLSEQQAALMCNVGRKQEVSCLCAVQNAGRLPGLAIIHFFTTITTRNTLIKRSQTSGRIQ